MSCRLLQKFFAESEDLVVMILWAGYCVGQLGVRAAILPIGVKFVTSWKT
jgi:hypothetical protein